MAMGVKGGGTGDGTDIRQYTYNGSDSQQFGFIKNSNGSYRIVTKVTNGQKGLSVNGRYTDNGANIHQYWYNSSYTNDHWFLELKRPMKQHSGDILIGLSSDAYGTSSNNLRCSYGYRGSATESANYFAQYITGNMYDGYNNRKILFNRQNSSASKNDFLSKSLYGVSGYNIDDVDLMFFCGHGTSGSGFHFSYGPNNTVHSTNPSSHGNANLNLPHSQLKLGYGSAKTKWLVAYTCNFLTPSNTTTFPMMEGGHILMGYASVSYLVRDQMGQLGLDFKLAERNMIDAYFNTSTFHTKYANFDATLAAICIPQARYDTIYNYVDTKQTYRDTQILYLTKFAPGKK